MPLEPDRFDARLAALGPALGLALPPELRSRLIGYLSLIERWTRVYNLTAVRDPAEMFTHHLLDCLAVVRPLADRVGHPGPRQVLDVGSGAGLPGVVLALLQPAWQVTCVDAVAKKAGFIRQVAAELGIANLHAAHGRIEQPGTLGAGRTFDLITSRAFASLHDFTELTRRLRAPTGLWAAMKAHLTDAERAELAADIELFHVEPLQVPDLDAHRCLVWMRPVPDASKLVAQPRQ